METLESALKLLLDHAYSTRETRRVQLYDLAGSVAVEDIAAPISVPPFSRSPLDGYALRGADIATASRENPVTLRVIGEACAGCETVFHPRPGEAVRIMTDAPVPADCDCVIRQEDTDKGEDTARFYAAVAPGQNVCYAGEDIRRGAAVLRCGARITAAHVGVLASLGLMEAKVYAPVRAALLCTGDELRQPGQSLPFGKIYDANRAVLTARLRELGAEMFALESREDDPGAVDDALRDAAGNCDVLLITGGVSVEKKDIFHQVLPLLGAERLFWKVAMKPGSPMMGAVYQGKPLLCLSGNPFAALACFEVFAVPVLRRLQGETGFTTKRIRAPLADAFAKTSHGWRLVRALYDGEAVHLTGLNHSSGSLASMIGCNCLIDIPAGSGALAPGMWVEVLLL